MAAGLGGWFGVREEEAVESEGEEEEEVRGRCWVRRAAMREDVKSWTCVRISRPIIFKIGIFFSFSFFQKGEKERKERKKKKKVD